MSNQSRNPSPAENALLPYMTKVGVGKTGSKQLSRREACEAMRSLLQGQFHPVTFGAFFMALRYKTEAEDELAGFLDAMYEAQQSAAETALGPDASAPPEGLLSCAGAYNGKARTLNISLAAGLVTVAAGVPVIFHGSRGIPTKFGMTISHLLEALGINHRLPLPRVLDSLHSAGIAYANQADFNPAFHALLPYRVQMGKRTILNTMEILSNPFGARYLVTGFFHDPYATLMGEALAQEDMPFDHVAVVKGIEGSDELRPGGVFYADIADGRYQLKPINSDELGLPQHISQLDGKGETLQDRVNLSKAALERFLNDSREDTGYRNAVLLNAGLRLTIAGKTEDIPAGIALAAEVLDSGAHREVLERWQQAAK